MGFRKPAIPMTLGGINFPSKKEAIERVKAILHGAAISQPLSETDFAIIRSMLDTHPNADQKIGCGVTQIEVRINGDFSQKARGFWLVRRDGTETDFSYKSCMSPRPNRDNFIASCRFAVREHMVQHRDSFFAVAVQPTCPLTGVPITPDTADVDHIPPWTFEALVKGFTAMYDLDPDDASHCEHGIDQVMIPTFSTKMLHDNWVQFHNTHAKYRVISKEANVTIVRKSAKSAS